MLQDLRWDFILFHAGMILCKDLYACACYSLLNTYGTHTVHAV